MTIDTPVLVWGAGAIGGSVGAALLRHGHDVTFVDTAPAHVAALADPTHGLAVEGAAGFGPTPVPALLAAALSGTWQTVLLCVKAHHTADAVAMLAPHLAADGVVLSLQNGLCARVIAAQIGAARTMAGFVNFGADVVGPGRIAFGNRGTVAIGELDGQMTDRLETMTAMLRGFEPDAIATSDIWAYLWGKLAYASFLFAQALGDSGIADCLARPELAGLWARLGGEVLAVAAAEGVSPRGFNGFDVAAFGPGANDAALAASIAAMAAFNAASSKTHSGVWRDLAIHRRITEVDAQLGLVVERGAAHGLACPTLAAMIGMMHEVEAGSRAQSDANLLELAQR
ncbi:ketopantoate reductase family protein [Polymorphobacter sp.]|uniref:ketopantoate reductase family protein n=1 Tax=Polymorphobacter sp. TaxID=1909290 RepID=UPI003F70C573